MARLSLVPVSLLLLAGLAAAFTTAAAADDDGELRIRVQYPTEEESQWLDRWAAKYKAKKGSGSGFSVQPATDEESAYLNRIFSAGKDGGGAARAGYDGHIEFDNDRPRIVVDKFHSGPRSSEPNDDLKNKEESHAERGFEEL